MIVFFMEAHLLKLHLFSPVLESYDCVYSGGTLKKIHLFYPLPESYDCVYSGGTSNKITFIILWPSPNHYPLYYHLMSVT